MFFQASPIIRDEPPLAIRSKWCRNLPSYSISMQWSSKSMGNGYSMGLHHHPSLKHLHEFMYIYIYGEIVNTHISIIWIHFITPSPLGPSPTSEAFQRRSPQSQLKRAGSHPATWSMSCEYVTTHIWSNWHLILGECIHYNLDVLCVYIHRSIIAYIYISIHNYIYIYVIINIYI